MSVFIFIMNKQQSNNLNTFDRFKSIKIDYSKTNEQDRGRVSTGKKESHKIDFDYDTLKIFVINRYSKRKLV